MSSFVVEDSTINRIVTWIRFQQDSPIRELYYTLQSLNKKYGSEVVSSLSECDALAQAMYGLNLCVYHDRYNEELPEDVEAFKYTPIPATSIQVLKSLRCWLYQCSEGEVPETALYRFMDDLSKSLALNIVESLDAYDKAYWG